MKIPFLQVHIITAKTLDAKIKAAKAEGRRASKRLLTSRLAHNIELTSTIKDLIKSRRKKMRR